MMTVIDRTRAATLFWRLAVVRLRLERTQTEIEALRAVCKGNAIDANDDLGAQLSEAAGFLKRAVDYLTPCDEHTDCAVARESHL